jgi:hypothetical protein
LAKMYSWEIEKKIAEKKYKITTDDFNKIINTSPQIKNVDYVDDENGYNFIIKAENEWKWKVKVLKNEHK